MIIEYVVSEICIMIFQTYNYTSEMLVNSEFDMTTQLAVSLSVVTALDAGSED